MIKRRELISSMYNQHNKDNDLHPKNVKASQTIENCTASKNAVNANIVILPEMKNGG